MGINPVYHSDKIRMVVYSLKCICRSSHLIRLFPKSLVNCTNNFRNFKAPKKFVKTLNTISWDLVDMFVYALFL